MEIAAVYTRQSRGKAKSISEQLRAGEDTASEEGWPIAERYTDGSSASRYARKRRDDWERLLADMDGGRFTILILWESSRGDRTLTTWSAMLDLCRERGVRIYVISHERLYDPRKPRDWKSLAEDGVASAAESDVISQRVRRGHSGAARDGRPSHGRAPFGFRRVYDSATGELRGQEPDDAACPARPADLDPAARPWAASRCEPCGTWHAADTVREVVGSIARAVPVSAVVRSLAERGVPTINGAASWYRQRVLDIARNPAYVSVRVYNEAQHEGNWPALVDSATFYAAQRVLEDPSRTTTRPGRQVHLLSYLATCAPCGAPLCAVRGRYRCMDSGCVTIVQADTDDLVRDLLLQRLARKDVLARLRRAGDDSDKQLLAVEAEVAQLHQRLSEWRRSAAAGKTSPESLAVIEAELTNQIRTAELRMGPAHLPPAVRQLIEPGADVRQRWAEATMAARRVVLRALAVVTVDRADVPGDRRFDPWRLSGSQWHADGRTWGEIWMAEG